MHRIDTSTAQVDKFGSGKNGFTGGNPQTGELPTALDENFFDSVQEEICNVIEGAGIALAKGTRNQLLSALKLLPRLSNQAFYTDTGAANAIVISSTPAITALVDGQAFDIACAAANTGAVTLKVNALPAYPVIGPVGALQGGEIGAAKGVIRVIWSAAKNSFLLTSQNTTGPQQVSPANQSGHAINFGQLAGLLSSNGYQKFPNGLIIQWGSATATAAGSATVCTGTLPLAFPNVKLHVFGTIADKSSGVTTTGMNIYSNATFFSDLTTAKFTVVSPDSSGTITIRYLAIGY